MRKLTIKKWGLIENSTFELKKVSIIIGDSYKTELLKILSRIMSLERSYFSLQPSLNETGEDYITNHQNFYLRVLQEDLKLADDGYIEYESDYIHLKISKSEVNIIDVKSLDTPDSFWWNTSIFYPVYRDRSLVIDEWYQPESLDYPLKRSIKEFVLMNKCPSNLSQDGKEVHNLMSLSHWGYLDDYLKVIPDTGDGYKFVKVRKSPYERTNLTNGLQYLAPICMSLEHIKNNLINCLFIDLPELGLCQNITQVLMQNVINDFVLRVSDSVDNIEKNDWQPDLVLTTNSNIVIDTIMKYEQLKDRVTILSIQEVKDHPFSYEIASVSEMKTL